MILAETNQETGNKGLDEVTAAEVFSLVDNCADFLSTVNNRMAKSFRQWTDAHAQLPIAEHGFSMLVRIFGKEKTSSILFDTGGDSETIVKNAERMGINLNEVDCIVMSHGHYDHCGGLLSTIKAIGKTDLPIILHKDMFNIRGTIRPDGTIRKYIEFPTRNQLKPARIILTRDPFFTAFNMVCVTGEIPRKTSYEKGSIRHRTFINGSWQPDPLIIDDRALVIKIKGKGLVIISGCAHAGIINTINYAKQITKTEKIYAVMGGFHLAGKDSEEKIEPTIRELTRINPKLIVPTHCTGWRAISAIAKALPDAFVWNSVGNFYRLSS